MASPTLIAVPNFSEGRDSATLDAIATAFKQQQSSRLLDVHRDRDHNRSVFTVAGRPGTLALAVLEAARAAVARIDMSRHTGVHPRVGAVDVAPIVYLDIAQRGAACAETLVLADLLGSELELPVFLYGELGGGRTRAELRSGGREALAARTASGELSSDFGPRHRLHPTAGAVLVAARPPLVAFNLELEPPATIEDARAIAAAIREGGSDGLPGVRAIGLWLEHEQVAQVSTNIEDHRVTSPGAVAEAVAERARIRRAELVGLAPRAAFDGFPPNIEMAEPPRIIEDALSL